MTVKVDIGENIKCGMDWVNLVRIGPEQLSMSDRSFDTPGADQLVYLIPLIFGAIGWTIAVIDSP